MKLHSILLTAAIFALLNIHSSAAVLYVNLDCTNPVSPYVDWSTASTNIQYAIDAANAGDTVLVTNGVYGESINFNGEAILLISANGPTNTLINPPTGFSAITFDSGETSNSAVSGFTITNGGISVSGYSSPTIISNVLLNCGTGVSCDGSSAYIIGNIISDGSGSGIYLIGGASAFIQGNIIQNNGSGIDMWAAGSPTIINNLIQNNQGTAISMANQCDADIVQNIIVNNIGDGIGGLVPSVARGPWAINNTIYGNSGNGINLSGYVSGCEIINNIVVGSPAVSIGPWYSGVAPIIQFNDFYSTNGNIGSISSGGIVTNLINVSGNISTNPFFVSASSGNFHLLVSSPCINAGTNGAPLLTSLDFDGNARILNVIVDMGAYELIRPI